MDEVWKPKKIASPCVNICVLDEGHGHCLGCFRTRDEIAVWSRMTPDERNAVFGELAARRQALKPKRRGGRAGKLDNL